MDIRRLDALVGEYVGDSIDSSTSRAYASGQRRYSSFCDSVQCSPFTLAVDSVCRFVVHLAEGGLQHSSIKGYLSAVRRMQIVMGLGDPFVASWPLLECLLKGVKLRQAKKAESRPQNRLPITPAILRLLRSFWEADKCNRDNVMLWAACCTCFFGFLRSGEITVPSLKLYDPGYHLSGGDVRLDRVSQPTRVYVTIKASKTDPFRKGVTICLGRTDNDLCPVAAMSAYLVVRWKSEGASPFFQFSSGAPLTREMLVKRVREALGPSGLR